jgi:hypothetical protein
MEPGGSLPHSQEPATCPYPEPVQSSSCPPIPLPEDPIQYYPPIYATTRFNIKKSYVVPTLRLCVLYGSQNKQQPLPYKTLRDWFL